MSTTKRKLAMCLTMAIVWSIFTAATTEATPPENVNPVIGEYYDVEPEISTPGSVVITPLGKTDGGGPTAGWYTDGHWLFYLNLGGEANYGMRVTSYWLWNKPSDVWTARMYAVHNMANQLRETFGVKDDNPVIANLSAIWWQDKNDLDMIAKTVYNEAGINSFGNTSDFVQQKAMNYVAQVVLNRVADPRFPNTVYDVLAYPGQYTAANYCGPYDDIPLECYMAAATAMDGNAGLASDVVYQANFPQGETIVEALYSRYNTIMYFCK